MPDLDFAVTGAEVLSYAAAPTLLFHLRIRNTAPGKKINSIMLHTQIRIEPARRQYTPKEEKRLGELFGETDRWSRTLRGLLWAHTSTIVRGFDTETSADLAVTSTFDFEVASAKYFYALEDGEAPLLFLFSGTVFYAGEAGMLQIDQVSWEKEATFRLKVALYKQMMESYFPNSAWLRIRQDLFDKLYECRIEHSFPTWEHTLEHLLKAHDLHKDVEEKA